MTAAIVILVVLVDGAWGARAADPHIELVGADSGIVPEAITALYQDRSGLAWIGSRE